MSRGSGVSWSRSVATATWPRPTSRTRASAQAFVGDASERFGGLDALINNAGVVSHAMIGDLDLDEWHRVLDTNLTAVYLITKAALPAMTDGARS